MDTLYNEHAEVHICNHFTAECLVAHSNFPYIQNPRHSKYQLTLHTYKLRAGHVRYGRGHSVWLSACLENRNTQPAQTSLLFRGALKGGWAVCTTLPKIKI